MADDLQKEVFYRCSGLFVALLSDAEREAFYHLCNRGLAWTSYDTPIHAMLGLGRVQRLAQYVPEASS